MRNEGGRGTGTAETVEQGSIPTMTFPHIYGLQMQDLIYPVIYESRILPDISRLVKTSDADLGQFFLQSLNWELASFPVDETISRTIFLNGGSSVQEVQKKPLLLRLQEFIRWQRFFSSALLFVGIDVIGSLEEEISSWALKSVQRKIQQQ